MWWRWILWDAWHQTPYDNAFAHTYWDICYELWLWLWLELSTANMNVQPYQWTWCDLWEFKCQPQSTALLLAVSHWLWAKLFHFSHHGSSIWVLWQHARLWNESVGWKFDTRTILIERHQAYFWGNAPFISNCHAFSWIGDLKRFPCDEDEAP